MARKSAALVFCAALLLAGGSGLPFQRAVAAAASGLGDLAPFRTIVVDTEASVDRGDLSGARTRIKDLETSWDEAEAGLKPRGPAAWHVVDKAIDKALAALRADKPNQNDSRQSLADLLSTIDQASKKD